MRKINVCGVGDRPYKEGQLENLAAYAAQAEAPARVKPHTLTSRLHHLGACLAYRVVTRSFHGSTAVPVWQRPAPRERVTCRTRQQFVCTLCVCVCVVTLCSIPCMYCQRMHTYQRQPSTASQLLVSVWAHGMVGRVVRPPPPGQISLARKAQSPLM